MRSDRPSLRIADVTEFYSPRGGVRHHLNTKGHVLSRHGHRQLVIAPGPRDEREALDAEAMDDRSGPRAGSAHVLRIAGPALPYDSDYRLLYRVDKVRRALLDFQPHAITIHSAYLAALAMARLPAQLNAVRTLSWHADFIDTYFASHFRRLPRALVAAGTEPLWAVVRRIANRCAATFVASRSQARKLQSHGIERVRHIPFGVDRRIFRPEAHSPVRRLELLGSRPNAALLIAVGRLANEKQWPCVIEGVRRLAERQPVKLVVFGDGPELERLRALAPPELVAFQGIERRRSSLAAALASADALVHGGPHETYGLAVAEAIACGLPVVVPHAGALLDLVAPSFAETFQPGDAAGCAAALARILGGDSDRYRAGAQEAARQVPDSELQILRLVDAYAELCAQRRTSTGWADVA